MRPRKKLGARVTQVNVKAWISFKADVSKAGEGWNNANGSGSKDGAGRQEVGLTIGPGLRQTREQGHDLVGPTFSPLAFTLGHGRCM
jgi:hypothetical protein